MKSPIAENGIVPTISVVERMSTCGTEIVILPAASAAMATSVTPIAAMPIGISTFAMTFAPGGSGSARLSLNRPLSRSCARITPAKMPGMIAAITENPEKR